MKSSQVATWARYGLLVACLLIAHGVSVAPGTFAATILSIPYMSQYQGQATQIFDCGPASVAMIVDYLGKRPQGLSNKDFVIQVRNATGNTSASDTTFGQLERALGTYGLSYSEISSALSPQPDAQMQAMKDATGSGKPVIALLHGADLGRGSSYGDHWVVVRGFSDDGQTVYLNDADNQSAKLTGWIVGGQITLSYATFRNAAYHAQSGPYGIVVGGGTPPSSPAPPSLQSPGNGLPQTSRTVTFSWTPPNSPNIQGYTLHVSTSSTIDGVGAPLVLDTGVSNTSYTYTFSQDYGTLWWSVATWNSSGQRSDFALPWTFAINTNTNGIELCDGTNYGAPCKLFTEGTYDDLGDWKDRAESVRFRGNYVGNYHVVLSTEINQGGTPYHAEADVPDLGATFRNNVRSMKIYLIGPPPPSLQSPSPGQGFNEGQAITLSWSATGSEYYGEVTGGPGGTLTFDWQSGTSKNIGAQWAGYTYSWRVRARNSAGGVGDWSQPRTFTVRPAAPSNLRAEVRACTQVTLIWTDNSGSEEGYRIYRDGGAVAQVGANAVGYQDTGLAGNTAYAYVVKAYRGSIESDASNTATITTPSCTPSTPTVLRIELILVDNASSQPFRLDNPLHPVRTVEVWLTDANNRTVEQTGSVTYDSASGMFVGMLDLGDGWPPGSYGVTVKLEQAITRREPGVVTIAQGTSTTLPQAEVLLGDVNGDNAIDLLDFNLIHGCYSDLQPAQYCDLVPDQARKSDLNDDGRVDLVDLNIWMRNFS